MLFGLRDTAGKIQIASLRRTAAVDFLKLHSVLLWVQSSAPPLTTFTQASNHVKHL